MAQLEKPSFRWAASNPMSCSVATVRADRQPEAHYYYDSRAEWTQVNDDLPKLGGEDGMQPL